MLITEKGGGEQHHVQSTAIIAKVDTNDKSCKMDNGHWYYNRMFRPAKYEPAVGDVVEVEWKGKWYRGICFNDGEFRVISVMSDWEDGCWRQGMAEGYKMRYIKKTTAMPDSPISHNRAKDIAKAYFSAKDAPYADRQAQWVKKHGIKVESKVKVVRKFEDHEDGFDGMGWDYFSNKGALQGKVVKVTGISSGNITLKGNFYPYFALEPAD